MQKILAGAELAKGDKSDLEKTVRAWHQAQQDLCLILCRELRLPVSMEMRRHHRDSQTARIGDEVDELVESKRLRVVYQVPNLAGPLAITANLMQRNIMCCLSVDAPEDRKRYKSRLKWLLRQIPPDLDGSLVVHIHWKNGGKTFAPLPKLRIIPDLADIKRPGAVPKQFDVVMITDLDRRFSGQRTFIEGLEMAVPRFYTSVASHIRAWQPVPTPGLEEAVESLAVAVEGIRAEAAAASVVQQGNFNGRRFSIFNDGSIEVETSSGTKWFKDFAALQAFDKSQ